MSIEPSKTGPYSGKLTGNVPLAGGWRQLRVRQAQLVGLTQPGQRLEIRHEASQFSAYVSNIETDEATLLTPPTELAAANLPWFGDIQLSGPHGECWPTTRTDNPAVVLASGAGLAAALALIAEIEPKPLLVMLEGNGMLLPFQPQPSLFIVDGLPHSVIAAIPLLEEHEIPSRLADPDGSPGCFEGTLLEMFTAWWAHQPDEPLDVFACLENDALDELRSIPALQIHALAMSPQDQ